MTRSRPELEQLVEEHAPEAIAERFRRGPKPSYLRDFVYGAIDGTVTTLAVVAGVTGAGLRSAVAIVLGVANLLADGFSMATSNFLANRAEEQRRRRIRREEARHVELVPAGEREELRQMLASEGLEGDLLARAVEAIAADTEGWIDVMMQREHGFASAGPRPLRAATATFTAFVVMGSIPLLPFVLDALPFAEIGPLFLWSVGLTGVAFLLVGVLKARVVQQSWGRSAAETVALGGVAAALAYGVGSMLGGLV